MRWWKRPTRLAEHFGKPHHPKGCWALDLLTRREKKVKDDED
jgi:hypothetical protein